MINNLFALTKQLINYKSISPHDDGLMQVVSDYLLDMDFQITNLNHNNVSNIFALYGSQDKPIIAFAGHIDVVPAGDVSKWSHDPFTLHQQEDRLYGRGIADMKGAIACFLSAIKLFIQYNKVHNSSFFNHYSIAVILTSDEEGDAIYGTKHIVEYFIKHNIRLKYCILGEPTGNNIIGDVLKIGRRGSLSGFLEIEGIQGHVAYPHLNINPIHQFSTILNKLINHEWDKGNYNFLPTALQFTNLHAGIGVNNVTPNILQTSFNLRYNDLHSVKSIQDAIVDILNSQQITYKISWYDSAKVFINQAPILKQICIKVINNINNIIPQFNTYGGTSDGRFLFTISDELIELGMCNDSIHQINENIKVQDLSNLQNIYYNILLEIAELTK